MIHAILLWACNHAFAMEMLYFLLLQCIVLYDIRLWITLNEKKKTTIIWKIHAFVLFVGYYRYENGFARKFLQEALMKNQLFIGNERFY